MTLSEFEILIGRMSPRLTFFAKGIIGMGAATAEDMVQEAVIKLWGLIEKEDVKNPDAMLWRILKNNCLDYIKLKKNSVDKLDDKLNGYAEESPLKDIEAKENFMIVHRAINALSEEQMMAVRLRDIMGYEMCEIAVILDTSEGNVRTLLSRARKNLREKLGKRNTKTQSFCSAKQTIKRESYE